MLSVSKTLNGAVIVIPIAVGAYLSGIVYLAEGNAIPFSVFQITLIVGMLLWGVKKIIEKDISFSFYGLEIQYLLYLSIIFFSLIYSPEREQGLFFAARYIVLIALTYLIYNCVSTIKEFRIICYSIIIIALVIALQNVIQTVLNPEIAAFNYINAGKQIIRSRGAESDPNIFASNFILPIMLLVAFMGETKSLKKRIFLYALCGALLVAVLLTYSRSSWVAIFIGAMIIMIHQKKYSFLFYSTIILLLALIGSDSVRNVIFSVSERIVDIFAGTSDDSSKFRILLLESAILMWFDSYTFGVGYQAFSTYSKTYYPPQELGGAFEPHNEFYTVLAELGLIGFIVFMFILWKTLKTGWLTMKFFEDKNTEVQAISLALFASFIGYLIFFQFIGGMQYHSILTINIGLLFCANKFTRYDYSELIEVEKYID